MRLSVDSINDKSPIWIIQLDDMLFRFVTRNGVKYRAGFYPDKYFLEENAYHFFLERVDPGHTAYDPDVLLVIKLIIEEFFQANSNVMLYICDPSDERQGSRSRLYRLWFDAYEHREEYTLADIELGFNGMNIFAGLLIKKANPAYQEILDAFESFTELLPYDTSIVPK